MKTKTYDVIMACGYGFLGVKDLAKVGTRITVCGATGQRPVSVANGGLSPCYGCPVKRKAKRKETLYYTEKDIAGNKSPTGCAISCVVAHTIEYRKETEK